MIPNTETFISHVAGHAGVDAERAERAARIVLAGLGAYLTPAHRELVSEELPRELASVLAQGDQRALPIEVRMLDATTPAGHARELVASVCCVLAEELSIEALAALRDDMPPLLAPLFAAADREIASSTPDPRYDTIATGAPGSRNPVSEAKRTRAQRDSVVRSAGHEETKLSTAQGTTQERAHETLAEGRPGYERSLSGSTARPRR